MSTPPEDQEVTAPTIGCIVLLLALPLYLLTSPFMRGGFRLSLGDWLKRIGLDGKP